MGIFDDEQNLPGVLTQVEADYSYGYDPSQFGTTDSVVIIGTAFDGPVGTPTPVYSVEHAAYIFGSVYDSVKREEASLVAGIQDAWDKGCRTIYGVRVGGKTMYKDFDLCVESDYKFRVSSLYPSNRGKESYFVYEDGDGAERMTFYKPISRATITEKKSGVIRNNSEMLSTTIELFNDYSYTRETRLVEVINQFNTNASNNVLTLSIVDKDGNDVTNSTEVYGLTLGCLYHGAYFIGRDANATQVKAITDLGFRLVLNDNDTKPFKSFDGKYYRVLNTNTDITQPYPIYATTKDELGEYLGIAMAKQWEFLGVVGATDKIFTPDSTDYEETSLSSFELYKRLGSGFAVTAHAISRGEGSQLTPRVIETDAEAENHTVPIEDGIYSVLQDAQIKYRVVNCVNGDDTITGKLPRAKDFMRTTSKSVSVLKEYINLTSKVEGTDTTKARAYKVSFESISADGAISSAQATDIYTDKIYQIVGKTTHQKLVENASVLENGSLFITDGANANEFSLERVSAKSAVPLAGNAFKDAGFIADGKLYIGDASGVFKLANTTVASDGAATFNGKKFVLGSSLGHVFVFKVASKTTGDASVENIGDLKTLLSSDEEKIIVTASNVPVVSTTNDPNYNEIKIISDYFADMTVEELVDAINNHPVLSRLFTAEFSADGALHKDEIVSECAPEVIYGLTYKKDAQGKDTTELADRVTCVLDEDRKRDYDYDLYIPYRTTDNFLRQLAQHCTYTELKTTPTWGFMGCRRLSNVSLANIAAKTAELSKKSFSLYAKTNYGHNMLDRNGLPYPIGKNVSLVFGQYILTSQDDSYSFISNGAAGYAGMVSDLSLDQSSTAQPISINSLMFTLTQSQLKALTAVGIVTFRQSFTKGIVVTDGITMAPSDSVYRRLSTSRIIGSVEDLIRSAAEPFIGKENHSANRNALHTAIKSSLDKIQGTLISAYDFVMNTDPRIEKYSYIQIDFKIVPIYEIREVRSSIKVVDSLETA